MPPGNSLTRLLSLRSLEEEQRRAVLDAAAAELQRLRSALRAAQHRERQGRESIAQSAHSASPADRIAGLVQSESARHAAAVLQRHIDACQSNVNELRLAWLAKRTERRQVEILLQQAQAREAVEFSRREQQRLDNWFASRHSPASSPRPPGSATRPLLAKHEPETDQNSSSVPKSGSASRT